MIKKWISPAETVIFLNNLLQVDRDAISNLFLRHVECSEAMAEHPTVQVGTLPSGAKSLRPIGILNGMFGTFDGGKRAGWGIICAETNDDKPQIEKFSLVDNDAA